MIEAFCRIPSVSADPALAEGTEQGASFVADRLREAGVPMVERIATGGHPIVLGEWIVDATAPTVLIYGHYDV